MANDYEIDKCLAALEVVYPNHFKAWTTREQLTTARQLYHRIWRDIDGRLLEAATEQWLSTAHPFHPSPGELRDLALRLVEHDEPSADEAWAEVLNALQHIGFYGVPAWSSESIANTMQSFGRWKDFCSVEIDQLPFVRAQFMKIYDAQRARQHDDRLMLPGVRETIAQLEASKRLRLTGSAS